jgi:hypothetical protein
MTPDNEAAINFCKMYSTDGRIALTAIRPDRKAIVTNTFDLSDTAPLRDFLELYNGERNIYFGVNPAIKDISKKAEREDIKEVTYFHVDLDPRACESQDPKAIEQHLAKELERLLNELHFNHRDKLPLPTITIFSGGGIQGFYKLAKPMPIDGDIEKAEAAKLYNLKIEQTLGGDNCHDVSRIMRLPGTVNLPDERKAKRGRKPALARVISFEPTRVYELSEFQAAIPTVAVKSATASGPLLSRADYRRVEDISELDEWNVSDRVKVICVQGKDPDKPKASRSEDLFDAVMQLVRCGVPNGVIFSILLDTNYGISASILDKGRKAEYYANRQIERAHLKAADPVIFEMNKHHATVNYNGKFRAVTFVPDPSYPLQTYAEFSSKEDFMNINVTPKVDKLGRGKYYLNHEKREQYAGVQFSPGKPAEIEVVDKHGNHYRHLNLYMGFSVDAQAGDCGLYLEHLRNNVCDVEKNGEAVYEYVLNLMAYQVQHPDNPQRVSLSMRGVPGCGKGLAATEYGKIFGRHFIHITNPQHLNGKFNAHLAESLFEFADETLNLNDPQIAALMKTHISERTKIIERKGIDAIQAPSYSVTWFATNETHPITIESGDRRYFPLHVNPRHAKDKPYFLAIIDQMNNGGRAALLSFLLARNVEDFNAEKMPATAELHLQKRLSVNVLDGIVLDWANIGHLPGATPNMPYVARSGELFRGMREAGGNELRNMSDSKLRNALKEWGFRSHPLNTGGGWEAPKLEQLRAALERKLPGTVWDHPEIVAWGGLTDAQVEVNYRARDTRAKVGKAQSAMGLSSGGCGASEVDTTS